MFRLPVAFLDLIEGALFGFSLLFLRILTFAVAHFFLPPSHEKAIAVAAIFSIRKNLEIVKGGDRFSVDPLALDVVDADREQAHGKGEQDQEIQRKSDLAVLADSGLENVRPVGEGQHVRDWLQK